MMKSQFRDAKLSGGSAKEFHLEASADFKENLAFGKILQAWRKNNYVYVRTEMGQKSEI